jgi:hypothetical protein
MMPPKPPSRPEKVTLWRYLKLFRQDILSAQPAKLYRAWMDEFRTPFFRSYMVNDPNLIHRVLKERPDDFPKSDRIGAGLRPLLGDSVFLTNGETWKRRWSGFRGLQTANPMTLNPKPAMQRPT